jgi:hypothetical protein
MGVFLRKTSGNRLFSFFLMMRHPQLSSPHKLQILSFSCHFFYRENKLGTKEAYWSIHFITSPFFLLHWQFIFFFYLVFLFLFLILSSSSFFLLFEQQQLILVVFYVRINKSNRCLSLFLFTMFFAFRFHSFFSKKQEIRRRIESDWLNYITFFLN